jgi:hypothetical protein
MRTIRYYTADRKNEMNCFNYIFPIAFLMFLIFFKAAPAYSEGSDSDKGRNGGNIRKKISVISSGFIHPYKLIFDNADLILTMDGAIHRISPSGVVTKIADTPPGPPGSVSKFGADFIFVDNPGGQLLRITRDGVISVIATGLGLPNVAVQEGSDFIVVDIGTPTDEMLGPARLLRVSLDGNVTPIATQNLGGPAGLYIDEDGYWVPDFILGRLLLVSREGNVEVVAEGLGQPLDIDFDGEAFIVTDFHNGFRPEGVGKGRIFRIFKSGRVEVIGRSGEVGNPTGLILRGPDILYTDVLEGTVLKIRGPRIPSKNLHHQD